MIAETILYNGEIHTIDRDNPTVTAVAIAGGKFIAAGTDQEVMQLATGQTKLINLNKKTVIPGINDSHTHLIRGGLNYPGRDQRHISGDPGVSPSLI
jgi:predicted amidohydrolase YtcJ